jgi:hypothetical protein
MLGLAVLAGAGTAATLLLVAANRRRAQSETEKAIDERIAESFPASDPPWQP